MGGVNFWSGRVAVNSEGLGSLDGHGEVDTAYNDETPKPANKRALEKDDAVDPSDGAGIKRRCKWLERATPGKNPKSWRPAAMSVCFLYCILCRVLCNALCVLYAILCAA